jgi:hypothetical protein
VQIVLLSWIANYFAKIAKLLLSRIAKIVKKIAIRDSKKLYNLYPGCQKCNYPG